MPGVIAPKRYIMDKKYYKHLIGKKMTEYVPRGRRCHGCTVMAGLGCQTRCQKRLQELGEFGSKVELKGYDAVAEVQLIEDCRQSVADF
jgi:hypothetical protein